MTIPEDDVAIPNVRAATMAVGLKNEDDAERIVHSRRDRRDKYLNYAYWAVVIALATYAGWHWMGGRAHDSWIKPFIPIIYVVPAIGVLNASGVFDHHAELRYRTKQMNARLAAIETMRSRRDDFE